MSLFEELKRRNVVRVGVAYVVIGWLLAQVAEFAFENFGAPEWVLKSFVVVLLLGLPLALFFAWAFEITPDGIKRERDVDRAESITKFTGRKLDFVIIGALVVALGYFVWERQTRGPAPAADSDTQSIAVLPFRSLSTSEEDAYFGMGVAEELLNSLAQFPSLKVAARTSAFSFGNTDIDLREVGEALGVAHVLEGSVRRSGDTLRITAQLIRAADGFHLWSETYERTLTDIFEIQDDIVGELSRVLQIRLGVGAGQGRAAGHDVDPRAYDAYLRGLEQWWNRASGRNRYRAIDSFALAAELDPHFADAWSAWGVSMAMSAMRPGQQNRAEEVLARALQLNPDSPRAHAGLIVWHSINGLDLDKARHHLGRALELAPNSAFTQYAAAHYYSITGLYTDADRAYRRALTLDPLNRTIERVFNEYLTASGRYDQAIDYFQQNAVCAPTDCDISHSFALSYLTLATIGYGSEAEVRALMEQAAQQAALGDDDPLFSWQATLVSGSIFLDGTVPDFVDYDAWVATGNTDRVDRAHVLIALGRDDEAIDMLVEEHEAGELFTATSRQYLLSPSRYEFPERIRRNPKYHELWSRPGLRELAAARRANGLTAGLPIEADES